MRFVTLAAVTLYLSIGYHAGAELGRINPDLASTGLRRAFLCVYWPIPLIKINVDFVRRFSDPQPRRWQGEV